MNCPFNLLVFEDDACDGGVRIGPDPKLGDRASVRADGVECHEQPVGGRSAGSGHEPSAFELDAERLVEQSPPCERAVEDDRPRGFSLERTTAAMVARFSVSGLISLRPLTRSDSVRREDAFAALEGAIKDEPDWAGLLSVVPIELEESQVSPN